MYLPEHLRHLADKMPHEMSKEQLLEVFFFEDAFEILLNMRVTFFHGNERYIPAVPERAQSRVERAQRVVFWVRHLSSDAQGLLDVWKPFEYRMVHLERARKAVEALEEILDKGEYVG